MAKSRGEIGFEHKGIGHVLSDSALTVPINQRSYAWEEEHVVDLFQDFSSVITADDPDYFLGTIVLTQSSSKPEVTGLRLAEHSATISSNYVRRERTNSRSTAKDKSAETTGSNGLRVLG